MSKVAERKKEMGWTKKNPVCSNCDHYTVSIEKFTPEWSTREYEVEKFKRCGLGDFSTQKTAWCEKWTAKKN